MQSQEIAVQGATPRTEALSLSEAVRLGAVNSGLYSHYFFPRTVRSETPEFHREIWSHLDDGASRYFAAEVFRGGAKTTLLRLYTSKRIAYGISNTVLFVGKGQDHAVRSVSWLRKQVEYNRTWARAFHLTKGEKWTDVEIEIKRADGSTVRVLALGITGQIRGVNIDDYRPDLIVVDDPCDEENTATPEQRKKTSDLFFGALVRSLAPTSEAPMAKMVLLQTPLDREDLVETCLKDPQWSGVRFGCFDPKGMSRWPERWTTEELEAEKQAYVARNQLSIWFREMECKLVSPETSTFRAEWLRYWDDLPESGATVLVIDPVPPPSETEILKGLRGKDWECFAVVRRYKGQYFICELSLNRGHEPSWTVAEFFRLALAWKPIKVIVEAVAYQATLAWLLRSAMRERGIYWPIEEYRDKRKKFDRIVDGLSGPASQGALYCNEKNREFIEQFIAYPAVSHDDALEAVAVGVSRLMDLGPMFEVGSSHAVNTMLPERDRERFLTCP